MSAPRRTATLTALLIGAAFLAPTGAATAAGETCRGEAATIVGDGPPIIGTPGDDVIVTGTSSEVRGGGGNDTVCVSDSTAVTNVSTGDGDDVVEASTLGGTSAFIGRGTDLYIGGPGQDWVFASGADDTITGGDGEDYVRLLITGSGSSVTGTLDGGAGQDEITVSHAHAHLDMELDELLSIDGTVAATVDAFTNAIVTAPSVSLRGNPEDNHLLVSGCTLRADGEGGDDEVHARFTEHYMFSAPCSRDARLSGGRGDDIVMGWRGRDRLAGGAGNDTIDGGGDKDVLSGGTGKDTINGSKGHDVAIGGPDRDTCDAEVEKSCER